MGIVVYNQLKTYVPEDQLECPGGVAIFIKEKDCNNSVIELKLQNNGLFNVGGYFIHATNGTNQTVATIDLSEKITAGGSPLSPQSGVKILGGEEDNNFKPNNETIQKFNLTDSVFGEINSIEIIPIRWQVEGNKKRIVTCSEAKISEYLTCG